MGRTYEELLDKADKILESGDGVTGPAKEQYARLAMVHVLLAQERRAQRDREEYDRRRQVNAAAAEALYNAEHGVTEP